MAKKIIALVYFIVGISDIAISSTKYLNADTYLKAGDYEMASKEYVKILESRGSASLSNDVYAMTGAFISYYMLHEYKKSFAFCKRVLKLQSYNSCAIFYVGQNLEALGNTKMARKIYKYYSVLNDADPYRAFVKARFDYLKRKEAEENVKSAIQMEGRINTLNIPENSLAIVYFVNNNNDEKWDAFGKGFSQLMLSDLANLKSINLIDRLELQVLSEELQLDQNQMMDENLLPRIGRFLKAENVVGGSFTIDYNSQININLAMVNLKQPDIIDQTRFTDKLDNVFQLEKAILTKIITGFNLPFSNTEKRNMNRFQTKNIEAFLAYCNGLNSHDSGNYDMAFNYFSLATKLDSRFYLAWEMQQTVDAIIVIEQGNLAMNHFKIMEKDIYIDLSSQISITRSRLENSSINLDLGYLPGNDSRKGAGGLDYSNIQPTRKMLPKPPNPPPN